MNLGIFADSFGKVRDIVKNPTKSWTVLLENNFNVTNFAKSGSSLYYSYDLFLKYHTTFDKVIFVATVPGRLNLPANRLRNLINDQKLSFHIEQYKPNIESCKLKLNIIKELTQISSIKDIETLTKVYETAIDYFTYLQHDEYDKVTHDLMVTSIKNIRPDAILIPVAHNSINDYKGRNTMMDISSMELNAWNSNPLAAVAWNDHRHAHMTPDNNEIFYKNVLKWIGGNPVSIDIDDYVKPTDPISKYFI